MSKVEVKKGDRWEFITGELYQQRGVNERLVIAGAELRVHQWQPMNAVKGVVLPQEEAFQWIRSLGGTVVEEREEEKAGELTLHAYYLPASGQVLMFKEQAVGMPIGRYLGTTTIHIAGVTT